MLHFSLCIRTFKSLCRAASSVDKGADATTRATNPARAQPPAAASPLPAAQGKLQSRDCKSCCRHSVATQGLSVASGSLACGIPGYHAPARASRLVPEPEHQHQAQPERLREPRPRSHPRDSTPASISRPSTRKLQRRAHPWMLRASCTTPHPLYYFFNCFVSNPVFPWKFCFNPSRIEAPSSPLQHPPAAAMERGPGVTCAEGVRHPPGEPLRAPGGRGSKEPPPEHPSPLPASPVPPTALPSPLPGRDPAGPSEPQGGAKSGAGGPAVMGGSGERVRVWKLRRCLWSAERQEKQPGKAASRAGAGKGALPHDLFLFFKGYFTGEGFFSLFLGIFFFFFPQPSWFVGVPSAPSEEQQRARERQIPKDEPFLILGKPKKRL